MGFYTIAIATIFLLFGVYEIAHGYHQKKRYNLQFLFIGGILTGIPFIVASVIILIGDIEIIGNWILLIGGVWIFGMLWETWQRRKFYRE